MSPDEHDGHEDQSSWNFEDLGLFLGAIVPSYVFAILLVYAGRAIAPAAFASVTVKTLVLQCALYAFMLGTLYVLSIVRHDQPLWKSLAWLWSFRGAWICLAVSPLLAIGVSALAAALHAPDLPTPVEQLISGRVSLVIVGFFAVVVGPFFEEILFRGFLFAILRRALGSWPAIALAGLAFALLHGPEYQWSWQHLTAVFLAGIAFGFARYKTGSTAGSMLLHSGYNMTIFAGYVVQRNLFGR